MLDETIGEIDLAAIDFVDGAGTPSNNPIAPGGVLELSAYTAQGSTSFGTWNLSGNTVSDGSVDNS